MSWTSLGIGSSLIGQIKDDGDLTPEGGSPPGLVLYDFIAYLIYCKDHKKIALAHSLKDDKLRAVWFPFIALSKLRTFKKTAKEGIQLILQKEDSESERKVKNEMKIGVSEPKRLRLHRIQIPNVRKFLNYFIYLVQLEKSPELKIKCCENTKSIKWYSVDDIINGAIKKLWGAEVNLAGLCPNPKSRGTREHTLAKAFTYSKHKLPLNSEEDILKECKYGQKEVNTVYAEFLKHCFPSIHMTINSFKDYLKKYEFKTTDNKFQMLFNAFDSNRIGFLEFPQVLYGLLIMEPKTQHRRYRIDFIFQYYDVNRDGYLDALELSTLIEDINPEEDIQTSAEKALKWFEIMKVEKNDKCNLEELSRGVFSSELKGTSVLCRSTKSILRAIIKLNASRESLKVSSKPLKERPNDTNSCKGCRSKDYSHALHSVMIDTGGHCIDARLLTEMEENEIKRLKPKRMYSIKFMFNPKNVASSILDLIRVFNYKKDTTKANGFLESEKTSEQLVEYLKIISRNLETIFSSEQRVIRINSPAYVLGDIHGNLTDLLQLESLLWRSFPIISANYVFLGNYVNYGKWSVECILYLFCLKIISPNKIFLLRGKHEIRDIQIQKTFQRECFEKYDEINGKKIWQIINDLFDKMPFALIVDQRIFCAHSGIPNTKNKVIEFNKINVILKNPSVDSPIVWQLLTNEPTAKSFKTKTGFSENQGLSSQFLFNEVAVNNFLKDNGFSHIICGNRQTPKGYEINFNSKFINVFSTSGLKNSKNKSAILFLTKYKLFILTLNITEKSLTTNSNLKTRSESKASEKSKIKSTKS